MRIQALGIDPAFANVGFARVLVEWKPGDQNPSIHVLGFCLVQTKGESKTKQVRKSSDDLRRAQELYRAMTEQTKGISLAFAEIPSGAQSAAAAKALGIALGVMACCPVALIQVSPGEVKRVVSGSRVVKTSKDQMIKWAMSKWPAAPWLRLGNKPDGRILASNEHLADAMAIITAGLQTPEFQQLRSIHNALPDPHDQRPAPNRRTILRI